MRVWTIVYNPERPDEAPDLSLIGGEPDVLELLDLLARVARSGHLSLAAAMVAAATPAEPPTEPATSV